ncbi:hypothetical protein PR048_004991 [Dryococelus australis]|uniref:C2H2-type domain-containing protein n=1 Tax=Dryococelus australis TaxID=614101 RepID=A0ABQ9I6Y7_9NEOP|nr:hypothetical protein PR048_004991 [Dryococelus australis]
MEHWDSMVEYLFHTHEEEELGSLPVNADTDIFLYEWKLLQQEERIVTSAGLPPALKLKSWFLCIKTLEQVPTRNKSFKELPVDNDTSEKNITAVQNLQCYSPHEDCDSIDDVHFPLLQKKFELVEVPQLDQQGACDDSGPEDELEKTKIDNKMEDGKLQPASDDADKNQPKSKSSCRYCLRKFVYRLSLLKHEGTHRNEKLSLSCKMCSRLFSSHMKLQAHKKTHERNTISKLRGEKHDCRKLIIGDYSCKYCRKVFKYTAGECPHDTNHCSMNPNKSQQCRFCSKSFVHRGSGWRHEKFACEMNPERAKKPKCDEEDMPNELFACKFCSKTFVHRGSCWRHEKTHSGIKPYSCKYCTKSFGEKAHFDRHVRMHLGIKPFHCRHCHKAFADVSNLHNHERTHSGTKPHLCSVCGKCYAIKAMLLKHELVHGGTRPYECTTCHRTYVGLSDLKKHQKLHIKEPGFLCSECGKSFSQNWQLKSHSIIHTDLKPFTCEMNRVRLPARSLLNFRMWESGRMMQLVAGFSRGFPLPLPFHFGTAPYAPRFTYIGSQDFSVKSCPNLFTHSLEYSVCEKSFNNYSNFRAHQKIHKVGPRPFLCTHCTLGFYTKSQLTVHLRVHTGERPYLCRYCPRSFRVRSRLLAHEEGHVA